MAEYINREALLAEYDRVHIGEAGGARKLMVEAPAVDAVEVVHGEWKKGHYEGGLLDGVNFDKCNICGHERMIENVEYKTAYNYCPCCGAKMDGDKK